MPSGATLKRSFAAKFGDALALTHFIFANLVIVLGETWDQFIHVTGLYDGALPGLTFIYRYIDYPVHLFISPFYPDEPGSDVVYALFIGEFVIAITSLVYGVTAFVVLSILSFPFKRREEDPI